jgi:hypothetical protein
MNLSAEYRRKESLAGRRIAGEFFQAYGLIEENA